MSIATRAASLPILALAALALGACSGPAAAPASDPPAGGDPTSSPEATTTGGGESVDTATGACPTVPQAGFELSSSPLVVEAPADGQVYGGVDHPVSWTFAESPGIGADVDLYYVNDAGDAISMGGIFLEDLGGNTWGTSNDVFWSDAADRPGFAILSITHDASLGDDGNATADREQVGVYCLTYQVSQ